MAMSKGGLHACSKYPYVVLHLGVFFWCCISLGPHKIYYGLMQVLYDLRKRPRPLHTLRLASHLVHCPP